MVCTYDVMFFSIKKGRCSQTRIVWMNLIDTMLTETVILAHKVSPYPLSILMDEPHGHHVKSDSGPGTQGFSIPTQHPRG